MKELFTIQYDKAPLTFNEFLNSLEINEDVKNNIIKFVGDKTPSQFDIEFRDNEDYHKYKDVYRLLKIWSKYI